MVGPLAQDETDAAGRGIGLAFAAFLGAGLWLVLACLLVVAAINGRMPVWGMIAAMIVAPLSAVAAALAIDAYGQRDESAFWVPALLPPLIAILRDSIPASMADAAAAMNIKALAILGEAIGNFLKKPGVEAGIFGLILVLVILLEPLGIYGRWLKIRLFFSTFPMYKTATFKRQKSYMRSERLR